jgi:hypothetical protein
MMPRKPALKVEKLSDEFGQYTIFLQCECGHTRKAVPKTFAKVAGWDAHLVDVVKRLRCSKCGKKKVSFKVSPPSPYDKPR